VSKVEEPGVSKVKLALGAASLFLFIVGIKRSFRSDGREVSANPPGDLPENAAGSRSFGSPR
jgi:hypothetical protein